MNLSFRFMKAAKLELMNCCDICFTLKLENAKITYLCVFDELTFLSEERLISVRENFNLFLRRVSCRKFGLLEILVRNSGCSKFVLS